MSSDSSVTTGTALDRRRNAYRDDLAAERLRGKVEAARFVAGVPHRVMRAAVAMRRRPDPTNAFDTELLFGEVVDVLDTDGGWAWVQAERDGYVGYVPVDALAADVVAPTHKVSAIGTFVYPGADFKLPPLMHLSINSRLAVADVQDKYCALATGGFVAARHVTPMARVARDFVDVAERLIGVPYLWGGRTRIGVDCSGLVQLALQAAGLPCPRDSDMQEAEVGANLLVAEGLDGLQRGDLVFWSGHVGIMLDGMMMLHANAHHMAISAEPLDGAQQRIERAGGGAIRSIKRPAALSENPVGVAVGIAGALHSTTAGQSNTGHSETTVPKV